MDPNITFVSRQFLHNLNEQKVTKITLTGGIEERIQNETFGLFGLQLEVATSSLSQL